MHKSRKLRTIISLIVFLSAIFFQAQAQNPENYYVEEPKLFSGGLVAGTNFCQVDGDRYAGYFKIGINAGAVLYARISDRLSLSMELLYSEKGSRSNFRQNSSSKLYTIVSQKINLSYAEIPVLLHVYDKKKSHLGAGLSYSQLISGTESVMISPSYAYDPADYPFKKSDLNFIASANLKLVKGLYANLRFQYSILPIRTTVNYEIARSQQYNNLWNLRLIYLF
ncbi:MAG: porin family protein [Phycisphaerales bacterium]|nr:porin family protein [Phycisphaerales bacterium]